jgi:hypothetical protein
MWNQMDEFGRIMFRKPSFIQSQEIFNTENVVFSPYPPQTSPQTSPPFQLEED